MKRVYFVRHGETAANAGGYAQGPEEPLNETGTQQARVVAKRCATLEIERIISSDMARAIETATEIAQFHDLELDVQHSFREVSVSEAFGGAANKEDVEALKLEMAENVANDEWFVQHNLESYSAVRVRVQEILAYLSNLSESEILVVSHGTILKFIFAEVLFGSDSSAEQLHHLRTHLRLANTGVSMIVLEDGASEWSLYHLNDISHFAE